MGFFSWRKSDDNQPILNRFTDRGATPCKMIDDDNNEYIEEHYEGYGVFDNVDFYELLHIMNGGGGDRDEGIRLAFSDDPEVLQPKLVSIEYSGTWSELDNSPIDPNQGYWS